MPVLPVIIADITSKPVGVESLFGPLGELLNALLTAVKWMHRGEGFLACLTLVVLMLVFGGASGVVRGLIANNRGGG